MNITIIKNNKGDESVHTSFAKACKCYKWDEEKAGYYFRTHKEFRGYLKVKLPTDVSIPCFNLLKYLESEEIYQSNDYNSEIENDSQEVIIELGEDCDYIITATVTNTTRRMEIGSDDISGLDHFDHESVNSTEIKKVINRGGEEVVLDTLTEITLLKKLEL